MKSERKIKAIIIDDSALVRTIISDLIQSDGDIEVIAKGKTGLDCIELAQRLNPDIITLDIEMPIMDGLTALKELKSKSINVPVIMLSVLTQHGADATFKALEFGAIDFVPKPSSGIKMEHQEIADLLKSKIRGLLRQEKKREYTPVLTSTATEKRGILKAVGIGTSTGGPNALQTVFKSIPEDFPLPIFVVQHMPPGFTRAFAERLNTISKIHVKEAEHREAVKKGVAYIAPGDFHMQITKKENNISIELEKGSLVNGHRPSIDVTLNSMKSVYGRGILGVIMTGMGRDGSEGIKGIHDEGGATIAQDEKTSVVFGMNRVAIESGSIDSVNPIQEIMPNILRIIKERGV